MSRGRARIRSNRPLAFSQVPDGVPHNPLSQTDTPMNDARGRFARSFASVLRSVPGGPARAFDHWACAAVHVQSPFFETAVRFRYSWRSTIPSAFIETRFFST